MFSKILKHLRTEKKLTQEELADTLNVTKGAIAMWETGKREPGTEMLKSIACYFNISIDYLLGFDEGIQNNNEKIETYNTENIEIENNIMNEEFYIEGDLEIYETPYKIQKERTKDKRNQKYDIYAVTYELCINNKVIFQHVYFDSYEYYEHCHLSGLTYSEEYDYENLYGLINAALEKNKDLKLKILKKNKYTKGKFIEYSYSPIIQTEDDDGTPIICHLALKRSNMTYHNLITKLKSLNIIK